MAIFSTNGKAVDFTNLPGLAAIGLTGNYSDVSTGGFKTKSGGGVLATTVEVLGTFTVNGNEVTGGTITNIIITNPVTEAVYSFSALSTDYADLLTALQTNVDTALALLLSGDDIINGSDLDDVINGYGGADVISLGGGDDVASGGAGLDKIHGGAGKDQLYGGAEFDELYGDADDDILFGGDGFDKLYGGADDDILSGHTGSDYLYGGTGDDILKGEADNDFLYGGDGKDNLFGGDGTDFLDGGAGPDKLDGDNGVDTADYSTASAGIVVKLKGSAFATVKIGGKSDDKIKNVENVVGNKAKDTIIGDGAGNTFLGLADNDVLKGRGGADHLFGGAGNDKLYGGGGADHFWFNTPASVAGVDKIQDFQVGVDTIHLSMGQFPGLPVLIGSSAVGHFAIGKPTDADDYFIYKPGSGKLLFDYNGNQDGGCVVFAKLAKHLDLTGDDFSF